jgi:hypothetical protein
MAGPVKTQVLNVLAALLAEVEGIAAVKLEQEFPFDLENIPAAERPTLFVWDDHDDPEPANLLTWHDLSLSLALFLPIAEDGFPAFAAAADLLAARIHNKLAEAAALRALREVGVIDLTPGPVRKARSQGSPSDAEGSWGEMFLPLTGEYVHAAADAFSLNLS